MPADTSEPAEPSRQRGTYAKGIARRQEILDRAIEVFAERGADRTSLRAIAREVGVTHAALTHYFGSLEELLVAVHEESTVPARQPSAPAEDATPVEMMIESARINRAIPGLVQLYSTLVATALEEGRITANSQSHFRSLLDIDEDGTTAVLASLAKNTVPVEEIGHSDATASADADAYPAHWKR